MQEIQDILYILFRKPKREIWLQTHNLLLGGERPEELLKTEEGRELVLKELRLMVGMDKL